MDELLNSLREMNRLLANTRDRNPDQVQELMVLVNSAIGSIESRVAEGMPEAEMQQMATRDILEIQRLFSELCNTANAPWHNN